jgi:hypothetical protein
MNRLSRFPALLVHVQEYEDIVATRDTFAYLTLRNAILGIVNLLGTHTVRQSCYMDTPAPGNCYKNHRFPVEIITTPWYNWISLARRCKRASSHGSIYQKCLHSKNTSQTCANSCTRT